MKATVILKKVRRWDENIGKLIVFAVTIIIAVGVLGTLAYFYNQSRQNATELSVLTSTTSSVSDLTGLGLCNSNTTQAYVSYTPVTDQYTLTCTGASDAEVNADKVKSVRGVLVDTNNCADHTCQYKVNR